jgi:hypothetical protein
MKKVKDMSPKQPRFLNPFHIVMASKIVLSFPSILKKMGDQRCRLLHCGGQNGFASGDQHNQVDGHSHAVTVIETMKGFIFGGHIECEGFKQQLEK